MSTFRKTDATRLTLGSARPHCPYLHFLVHRLVRSSLLGMGAVLRPRPSTRAPRGTFCCKQVSARMQRQAIGGGVIIGIVICRRWGAELRPALDTERSEDAAGGVECLAASMRVGDGS